MKKSKRILAMLCAFTLIVGMVTIGNGPEAKAGSNEQASNEHFIVSEAETVTSADNLTWVKKDYKNFGVDVSSAGNVSNLILRITCNVADADIKASVRNQYINVELGHSNLDGAEVTHDDYQRKSVLNTNDYFGDVGEVTIDLNVSDMTDKNGRVDINKPINWFRIYGTKNVAGLVIQEVKLINTKDYIVYEDLTITSNNTTVLVEKKYTDFNIDMSKAGALSNVELQMEFYIPDETVKGNIRNQAFQIELGHSMIDGVEVAKDQHRGNLYKSTNDFIKNTGLNSLNIKLSDMDVKGSGIDLTKPINYLRIYHTDSTKSPVGLVIRSIKLVDLSIETEWPVLNDATVDVNVWKKQDCNINISRADEDIDTLMLYIKCYLSDEVYEALTSNAERLNVELSAAGGDTKEYQWGVELKDLSLKKGENVLRLPFSEAKQTGDPTIESTLKWFRVFCYDSTGEVPGKDTLKGMKLEEVKVVDATPHVETYASGAVDGKQPKDLRMDISHIPTGYLFAGWYTNKECTEVLEGSANGTAYAKYVNGDVLDIKAQIGQTLTSDEILTFDADADEMSGGVNTNNALQYISSEGNVKAGTHGLKGYGTGDNWLEVTMKNSVDISEAKGLGFWLYISDPDLITGDEKGENMRIQFGNKDGAYYNKTLKGYGFQVGWNKIDFDFSDDIIPYGTLDKKNINWFRILQNNGQTSSITYIVDELCVYRETTDVRFITTVDTCHYREVGFDITINNTTLTKSSDVVYRKLYAVGANSGETILYQPYFIAPQSEFFDTYTICGIPSSGYNEPITVQSYWITQDGTKVYGPETRTLTIAEMIAAYN